MSSSDVDSPHKPPKVLTFFLVKFDVKKGNTVVWCRKDPDLEDDNDLLDGIEFKAMPSGLHSRERDTIYFAQSHRKYGYLEGIAVFRQNGFQQDSTLAREDLQMYSLGVLVQRKMEEPTKIWAFAEELNSILESYMQKVLRDDIRQYELYLEFEEFFKRTPARFDLTYNHPILAVTELFTLYGSLVFELWKCVILRKRVLLIDSVRAASIEDYSRFVYILSVLGTIPSDLESSAPDAEILHPCPLYCVTVADSEWLHTYPHYIAFTTDEVLLDKTDLYDVAVVTKQDGRVAFFPTPAKATARDNRRFANLVESLQIPISDVSSRQSFVEQALGVLRSIFSEDSFYGFLWWASAGEQTALEASTDELDGLLLLDYQKLRDDRAVDSSECPAEPEPWEISAFGYFHQLTRRIFQTVDRMTTSQDLESAGEMTPVIVELPDLFEMGLDPFARRDCVFIVELIHTWWNRQAVVKPFINVPCC